MRRLAYGILSSLVILSATVPARAEAPAFTIAQVDNVTIEQMYRQQRVLSDELQTMMAQMKTMMAEMKALTALPPGKTPTMADLYKQQQVMSAQLESLLSRSRFDTIQPRRTAATAATTQEVYQQQSAMVAELKVMMADLKGMMEAYRGRATEGKR